ncbi:MULTISPECIES: LCP family protein [Arthrobacter]|uniref:LytR family transcriptional regulator n=1 Tax=Arthrobacter terricola TaxID=2547396 RepID=A0A4R5KDL1_9MICC|nr:MULTISPECIES: LCP family protein [Arthrobacter]MBT8162244.1 LCP family protein [Arthrobacter sp. GN70]TDF92277.1 LytR family transcriptional regulator [Arthrobacter terricola]
MTENNTPRRLSLYEQLLNRDRDRKFRRRRIVLFSALAVALLVAGAIVYVGGTALNFNANLHRSGALNGQNVPKLTKDTNILVMGLDTRVDEQGKPLPPEMYDALHAGDENTGGYNSNVLMLIHIPADGSKAAGISIPRDDYVDVAGIPAGGPAKAKIKEAYGYGFDAEKTSLINAGKPDDDTTYQAARDGGRKAEIATVSQFLGNNIHIDHFIEVTMAAFYQTAQAIAPITVCINRATQDTFSGADFKAGIQQIDAKQAMAFVRQRRDTTDPNYQFSDLDRERRQQAFITSVSHQLKQAGTFTDIGKMQGVLSAVSKNIVVDADLNLIELAQQATALTGGNIAFTTLPITGFGWSPEGASINTIDLDQVQATVKDLLSPAPATTQAPAPDSASASAPADAGGQTGPDSQTATVDTPAPSAAAAPAAASSAAPSQGPGTSTYADSTGALQGGSIPCVK